MYMINNLLWSSFGKLPGDVLFLLIWIVLLPLQVFTIEIWAAQLVSSCTPYL